MTSARTRCWIHEDCLADLELSIACGPNPLDMQVLDGDWAKNGRNEGGGYGYGDCGGDGWGDGGGSFEGGGYGYGYSDGGGLGDWGAGSVEGGQ